MYFPLIATKCQVILCSLASDPQYRPVFTFPLQFFLNAAETSFSHNIYKGRNKNGSYLKNILKDVHVNIENIVSYYFSLSSLYGNAYK